MIVTDNLGSPLCHQKIVPGNTITGLSSEMLVYTERTIAYTSGGTTQIVPGDWIVGATSAAKAKVVAITLTSGSWGAGTAAGVITVNSQHGTFQSENIKVAGGTNDATIAANTSVRDGDYLFKGMQAKSILVSCAAQTALAAWDGGKPDQTALVGHQLPAASSIIIQDTTAIRNFKCVDNAAGSASTLSVTYYY